MSWQSSIKWNWLKRLTVVALALFISGTNNLFCCGQLMDVTAQSSSESCATDLGQAVGNDDCCSENSTERHNSEPDPCTEECCILSAPLAEIPSVAQFSQVSFASAHASLLVQTTELARRPSLPSRQVRSIHQEATYLRCCAFLI